MTEQPATECIMCGGRINAGTYPPFCCDDCEETFNIEVMFDKWAREQANRNCEDRSQ